MSPEDAAYLDGMVRSIREEDEQRTLGERVFTLMLVALMGMLSLLAALHALQAASWSVAVLELPGQGRQPHSHVVAVEKQP